ncbi:MAG: pantoate--beta-alanine ligase [Desulfotignum sp.]|nr:pantoate--beta-alanine ligase [Desulfotignum sp.]
MQVIATIDEMARFSENLRIRGQTIAFVPTMGYLHEGHLALMAEGKKKAENLVVSIFVNPAQFGPNEDFSTYPRAMEQDLEQCRNIGADAVFIPVSTDIYPTGFQTYVELEKLPHHLCGLSRPVFFKGVATVVTKLFNIVKPNLAVFGEKDYQQLAIIRQLVTDLNFDIEIVGVPIVREPDGLAKSSRNKYLSQQERPHALLLYRCLDTAQKMVKQGETDARKIVDMATEILLSCPDIRVDYVCVCDPVTLDGVDSVRKKALMALAVWLGKTRLIDNRMLVLPDRAK